MFYAKINVLHPHSDTESLRSGVRRTTSSFTGYSTLFTTGRALARIETHPSSTFRYPLHSALWEFKPLEKREKVHGSYTEKIANLSFRIHMITYVCVICTYVYVLCVLVVLYEYDMLFCHMNIYGRINISHLVKMTDLHNSFQSVKKKKIESFKIE